MRENTDQKNSEYGHFLRSAIFTLKIFLANMSKFAIMKLWIRSIKILPELSTVVLMCVFISIWLKNKYVLHW